MKLKRPAVLASISLLTLGGLYYGLFRPSPEIIGHTPVAHEPEAAPVLIRPAENAGVTSPPPSEKPQDNQEPVKSESANAGVRAGKTGSLGKQIEQPATPGSRSLVTDRKTSRPADASAEEVAETGEDPVRTPVGIRLAPDVRLPVAAMPNDLKLNPIKQKALQHIIDEYYQTVAAAASDSDSTSGAGTSVVEENGEETRVITNSPAVDAARKRADLRFKALFGHAAYNRMTMNTLLESRLPQNNPGQ